MKALLVAVLLAFPIIGAAQPGNTQVRADSLVSSATVAAKLLESSEALQMRGDYKGALHAHQRYVSLKDSVFNMENNSRMARLEARTQMEKKDDSMRFEQSLTEEKQAHAARNLGINIGLVGALLGFVFVAWSFYGQVKKTKRINEALNVEKKKSDDLLLNILPFEVAEELKGKGSAEARQFEDVSVLFTDFVNFTAASEKMGPQVLVKELHEYFSAFDAIIQRNELEKIKTVGDAYIAACGLPLPDPRHAQRCVKAALEIQEFIEERRKQEPVFEIRIGINSGPVVAGIVGVKKFAYDIWGDTVNTAARMEQHSEAGRINISQTTYELVKDEFECVRRGRIAAKNKGEVDMYFVERIAETVQAV